MTQRASSEQQRSKVGFPIRKFTDQSLFAAPHDLSQRTTSFIASQRQGIHQIPLRHLIALIAKARFHKDGQQRTENGEAPSSVLCLPCARFAPGVEKTSFASNASGSLSGQAPSSRLVAYPDDRPEQLNLLFWSSFRQNNRMRFLFTMSDCKTHENARLPEGERSNVGGRPRVGLPAFLTP